MSRENIDSYQRDRNRTADLNSDHASRMANKEYSTASANVSKTYQELEKELLVQKNYINQNVVMRNNFIEPVEPRKKSVDPDQLSMGSVEHKPLGVVREGFKKASFSNIGTVKDLP